ncbi:hypothetical protein ACMFMG_011050 [Clarireedia jacksonii]
MGSGSPSNSTLSNGRKSPLKVVRRRPTAGESTSSSSSSSSAESSQESSSTPIEELPLLSPWTTITDNALQPVLPPSSPRPRHANLPTSNVAFSSIRTDGSPDSVDMNTLDAETEIDIHISHEELMSRRHSVILNEKRNDDTDGIPGDITFWTTLLMIRRRQAETAPAPPSAPRKRIPRPDFDIPRYNRRGHLIWPLEKNMFVQDWMQQPQSEPWRERQSQSEPLRQRQSQQPGFVVNTDIGSSFAGFHDRSTILSAEDEGETEAAEAASQQDENMSARDYRTPSTSLGVGGQLYSTTARGYLNLSFMDKEHEEYEDIDSENAENVSSHSVAQQSAPALPTRSPQVQLPSPRHSAAQPPKYSRRQSMYGHIDRPPMPVLIETANTDSEPMDWELTPDGALVVDISSSRFHEALEGSRDGPTNQGLEPNPPRGDTGMQEDIFMSGVSQNGGPSRVN